MSDVFRNGLFQFTRPCSARASTGIPCAYEEGHAGPHNIQDARPTKMRQGDQVLPSGTGECVQDRIIAEMEKSKEVGTVRYGDVLRTFNGRRSLQDVREEARDLFVYLTQIEMEAEASHDELVEIAASVVVRYVPTLLPHNARAVADAIVTRILGHVAGNQMQGEPA